MIPNKVVWTAIAIVLGALAFVSYYTAINNLNFSEMMALTQVIFTILAFAAVLYTLYYASGQFRKAMARPKLGLAFSEDGEKETTIEITPNQSADHKLSLWVINTGNAVTDLFQIDTEIPQIFHHSVESHTVNSTHRRTHGDNRIVSFINKHEYVCFVNIPTLIPNLILHTTKDEYDKYSNHLVIPYKIYGDWAETQEGELKVTINKQ